MEAFYSWPGKSDNEGNELPAVVHMLDVAACAECLIKSHTAFADLSCAQRRAMVILVALHDVGKLSESFRALIREDRKGAPRHWQLSDFLLCGSLDCVLAGLSPDRSVRTELYGAVSGHHGCPPTRLGGNRFKRIEMQRSIGSGKEAALDWVSCLLELFPDASLESMTAQKAKALGWALSGLTVAADWIGSNGEWFPVKRVSLEAKAVLEDARRRAGDAIRKAGLEPPDPARIDRPFPDLGSLRPMQDAASEVEFSGGPQLVVIEDATGAGKTEAAVILAHRMIRAGKARGIFFALPTMATSDAMFERMLVALPQLFETPPTAVLAHGRARLRNAMRDLQGALSDGTPESEGSAWLSDNRRRALLANVGVGTVDQALLGILPSRFSTLRLFGLSDKVLIVDEAHSYDPYMQRELEALLKMQARLGGSAILMTATLPLATRQSYVKAFQDGLEVEAEELHAGHYPGIHLVGRGKLSTGAVSPFGESVRTVDVRRLREQDSAIEVLTSAANCGAACVWVRNAVDDAIDAVLALRQNGVPADLLHARFALVDRLGREQELLSRFGKNGIGRKGRILVATQVVEASLDLDFDVMVSDLAPIGSLIQRAGRLWRHMGKRPKKDRPVHTPTLHVVSPDPDKVEGEDWLRDVLGRGSWVYRLDEQWRTAKALFDKGAIVSPCGLRELIEAVHCEDKMAQVPQALQDAELSAEGNERAQSSIARGNVVETESGYVVGTRGAVSNDALFPTRLGEPQVTLVLARRNGGRLAPLADGDDLSAAWALSEVSASLKRFGCLVPEQDTPEIRAVKSSWPEWRREACKVCPIDEDGCTIGHSLLYDECGLRVSSLS